MTVIEAVQMAGIEYAILIVIGFLVAGMIKAMSMLFKSEKK
jgi:hypothetical protein